MSKESESAELILKLYDLRREPKMREARSWFISFFPESFDDLMRAVIDSNTSANYRMVTTYWDMAASFVNRGAIDEAMFLDSASEAWVIFAKVQPFLAEYREKVKPPTVLKNLEDLLMRQPDAQAYLDERRESMKLWMAKRAELEEAAAVRSRSR